MNRDFEHEGKTFEIREAVLNERYAVKVFLDGLREALNTPPLLMSGRIILRSIRLGSLLSLPKLRKAISEMVSTSKPNPALQWIGFVAH